MFFSQDINIGIGYCLVVIDTDVMLIKSFISCLCTVLLECQQNTRIDIRALARLVVSIVCLNRC